MVRKRTALKRTRFRARAGRGVGSESVGAPTHPDATAVGKATRVTSSSALRSARAWPSSNAAANSEAVAQRSSRALARLLSRTRVRASGTSDGEGNGMGSWRCFMSTANGVSAEKGTRPVSSS